MGFRRKSRENALKILYQLDICPKELFQSLEEFWEQNPNTPPETKDFTQLLVSKTLEYQNAIDNLIKKYSKNWALERMSLIDRNILRFAVCEFCYMDDIPAKVTINEAIEIAKKFGTEKSPLFINGVLDSIKKEVGKT
jgi:N utilization substance protein B